jgi:predicted regulator of Ras-like GTPase activity (Roadblock/LC7/MglB family)
MTPATASKFPFENVLAALIRESGALTVLLITRQGTMFGQAGDTSYMNTTAMAALVAGMFSATREVARMVGEDQFSILLQQGERRHIHISLVAGETMMIVVFEDSARTGIVRHACRKAAEQMAAVMPLVRERETAGKDISLPAFREYALNLIDRIFQT